MDRQQSYNDYGDEREHVSIGYRMALGREAHALRAGGSLAVRSGSGRDSEPLDA
ncbi:MAG: hypothetical protein HYU52_06470 [Acidobacteria bacterium]|nr:hypothetical protein [Acidobacteriota bacterium]